MPVKLEATALTDRGRKRELNEDTAYQRVVAEPGGDATGLLIVADGVGGRLAGQAARYWAVETIKSSLADLIDFRDPRNTMRFDREQLIELVAAAGMEPDDLRNRVLAAIDRANSAVREYARRRPAEARDAGSTVSMALIHGLQAWVANVGDSRAYMLRDNQLGQITKDHSVVQRLIDEGRVRTHDRYTHPKRHMIFRSLGSADAIRVDIFALTLAPGDLILLCTDGLWEMVRDPSTLTRIICKSSSLDAACLNLVAAANAAGGDDNIGVVLARVHE